MYRGQRSQNMVYADAVYMGLPRADTWDTGSCMTKEFKHDLFTITK